MREKPDSIGTTSRSVYHLLAGQTRTWLPVIRTGGDPGRLSAGRSEVGSAGFRPLSTPAEATTSLARILEATNEADTRLAGAG
jgi:hypothetical protein